MDCPKKGQESGPERACAKVAEKEKKEGRRKRMEEDIDGMEGGRVVRRGSEKRGIGHVREPKERHIHGGRIIIRDESRADICGRQALEDDAILGNVDVVVEIDEGIADGRGKEGEDEDEKEKRGEDWMSEKTHGRRGSCHRWGGV